MTQYDCITIYEKAKRENPANGWGSDSKEIRQAIFQGIGPAQMGHLSREGRCECGRLLDEESECAICEKIAYETAADLRGANETL